MKVAALVAASAMVLAGSGSAMAAKAKAGTLTCKGGAEEALRLRFSVREGPVGVL
jgi:hypothetical protein